jgi:hypothetical protein
MAKAIDKIQRTIEAQSVEASENIKQELGKAKRDMEMILFCVEGIHVFSMLPLTCALKSMVVTVER